MSTPPYTTAERRELGRIAANERWSKIPYADRPAATQAARDARWQKYLDAVPASVTDPAEREQLAAQARRADMQRASLVARRNRRARKALDAQERRLARRLQEDLGDPPAAGDGAA
jgi:hypothetical protein